MTPVQKSERSKKARRSGKRQAAALSAERAKTLTPHDQSIIDATTPEKTAADVAGELDITPAAVRAAWRRAGLAKRRQGKRKKGAGHGRT